MLSEESISRIDVLYSVAKLNDSALSLKDLHVLLRAESTMADLEDAFVVSPTLSSKYQLQSGFVFEREGEPEVGRELIKRTYALQNVGIASELAKQLRRSGSRVIAISGSTAYASARASDDLDFFCIAENDSAWIFLTKALLLLRASRLASNRFSKACLSCVIDMRFAKTLFKREQDALFARDALTAIVIEGGGEYEGLLTDGAWMRGFFPRFYGQRVGPPGPSIAKKPSVAKRVLNSFLFLTVGRYIAVKSMLQNRRLAGKGDDGRLFVAKTGEDHCIYESLRYRRLREMYRGMAS